MAEAAQPDLELGGLRIWVHGREFPEAEDYWDGNWLNITVRMSASGAYAEASGPFVRIDELAFFAESLRKLHGSLKGVAELKCLEPNLYIRMEGDSVGRVAVKLEVTPDHLSQLHQFEFGTDQTYLPPLIASCEAILRNHPTRGSPDD